MEQLKLMKKALIRDTGYPIGYPAPMHIDCECGRTLPVVAHSFTYCPDCHTEYDEQGWIRSSEDDMEREQRTR